MGVKMFDILMAEEKKGAQGADSQSKWRYWFIFIVLASSILVLLCSYSIHDQSKRETVRIIAIHQKATQEIRNSIATLSPDTVKSQYAINDQVLQQMEHSQQMIKELLEIEFGRIQSERNVLEIWAAVITIVFLVFSFYSTFKTDDMLKDARKLLDSLNVMHTKATGEKAAIEGELRGILNPYVTQANELATNIKRMESEIGKISDLPEKMRKIDDLDKSIANADKKLSDLESNVKIHGEKLENLREDIDELSFSEPDEVEP